jgi:hypothetical protein
MYGKIKSVKSFFYLIVLISIVFAVNKSFAFKHLKKINSNNNQIIGNSLPGDWRPFSINSPWNTPIPENASTHPLSSIIINIMKSERNYLSMVRKYATPIWVVDSSNMQLVKVRSDRIFDIWDKDNDGWSDVGVPLTPSMWGEPTEDGQILIVDPFKNILWDLSSYRWSRNGYPISSTFDIWDLNGEGVANPSENTKWVLRGGRASGFPGIAGLLRPEELQYGEIRHALIFSFNKIRRHRSGADIFIPPACRSDGKYVGLQFPIMGMRFQLDPSLTDEDFDKWGLNREGKIIAKALQKYGMFLGLTGGKMKLITQLLGPTKIRNIFEWEKRFPNIFKNVKKIPFEKFRIIDTGKPIIRKWHGGLKDNLAVYE